MLLLDEPTAGISVEEVPAILQVIENIKKHPESTIVLIEHKMDMVLGLSDHLIVLFHGELLAEGLPEEIMKDERVQSAYLGDYIVALLQVNNIETYLDQFHILQGVSLAVEKGTITVLFGRNGAGKTTTLRSVMGFHHIAHGEIYYASYTSKWTIYTFNFKKRNRVCTRKSRYFSRSDSRRDIRSC